MVCLDEFPLGTLDGEHHCWCPIWVRNASRFPECPKLPHRRLHNLCCICLGGELGFSLTIWRRLPTLYDVYVSQPGYSLGFFTSCISRLGLCAISVSILQVWSSHSVPMQVRSRGREPSGYGSRGT